MIPAKPAMARPEPRATFTAPMAPRGHHTPSDPNVWRQTNEYPSRGLPRGIDGRRISRCPEPFKVLDHIVRQRRPARQRDTEPVLGADVAQLVEQLTRNEQVVRSNRIVGSIFSPGFRGLTRAARLGTLIGVAFGAVWCRLHSVGLPWRGFEHHYPSLLVALRASKPDFEIEARP